MPAKCMAWIHRRVGLPLSRQHQQSLSRGHDLSNLNHSSPLRVWPCHPVKQSSSLSLAISITTSADSPTYKHLRQSTLKTPAGSLSEMCRVQFFESTSCDCEWFQITKSCGKDKDDKPLGFGTCPSFKDGKVMRQSEKPVAKVRHMCPKHDKNDEYNGNETRMVALVETGIVTGRRRTRRQKVELAHTTICCTVM